ncbi:hypothetical protein PQO03_10570 [Lentisphaera profundi]|uniref:Uncharacterized protein n=1 Tax=Lentisphaera profundi TaxID=1658616 RepID=A0ABY7VR37_9BACT|nr:hypothetical protein [Lentisphaera profundi]WDE96157.1 hypothetical protein PQO03_10570 [Lentisphaera profundi]
MSTNIGKNSVSRDFIDHQVVEMQKHKWLESEKAGADLGEQALLEWVDKYYDKFSKAYFSGKLV